MVQQTMLVFRFKTCSGQVILVSDQKDTGSGIFVHAAQEQDA